MCIYIYIYIYSHIYVYIYICIMYIIYIYCVYGAKQSFPCFGWALFMPSFDACHHIVRQPPASVSEEPGTMRGKWGTLPYHICIYIYIWLVYG